MNFVSNDFGTQQSNGQPAQTNDATQLIYFSRQDALTPEQAIEGFIVFGESGCGKSKGVEYAEEVAIGFDGNEIDACTEPAGPSMEGVVS